VYKRNTVESVGILKRIPGLLNTMRKEGFARVNRQRKGDALRCLDRLREKPSKILARCKECTKETVKPSYNLRRKSVSFQEGRRMFTEGRRGMMNLEGFQAEQSRRRVYIELCKECRSSSRIA
jgi:hypothetical protein